MGIQFETDYNMETLTAMAKGLRKTVRKKRSRRVHIFAAVVLILGLLTILATTAGGEPLGASGVVTMLAMLVVILVSLFEDKRATSSSLCPRTIRRRMTRELSAAGALKTSARLLPKRRENPSQISNKSNIVQKIGENQ